MKNIQITTTEGKDKLFVSTPYKHSFVSKIKKIGGIWDYSEKKWGVPKNNSLILSKLLKECFGNDGTPCETVDIEITLEKKLTAECEPVFLFGTVVAAARGRDSGAKVPENVAFLRGEVASGGSARYWQTIVKEGAQFIIYAVPRQAIENRLDWKHDYGSFKILETECDTDKLEEEREFLLGRIAEIDALLGNKAS